MSHICHKQERGTWNKFCSSFAARRCQQGVVATVNHKCWNIQLAKSFTAITRCIDGRKLTLCSFWIKASVVLACCTFARFIKIEVLLRAPHRPVLRAFDGGYQVRGLPDQLVKRWSPRPEAASA